MKFEINCIVSDLAAACIHTLTIDWICGQAGEDVADKRTALPWLNYKGAGDRGPATGLQTIGLRLLDLMPIGMRAGNKFKDDPNYNISIEPGKIDYGLLDRSQHTAKEIKDHAIKRTC